MTNYKSLKLSLVNRVMLKGKKWKSEIILIKNFKLIQKKKKKKLENIIKLSIINSSPYFSIKKLQRKKKNPIEFPFLLSKENRVMFGLKNLTKNSCHRKLSLEISDSSNREGLTVSNKKNLHKESFLKKKVANYRWFL